MFNATREECSGLVSVRIHGLASDLDRLSLESAFVGQDRIEIIPLRSERETQLDSSSNPSDVANSEPV